MQGSAAYRCTVGRWLDQPAALSHQHEPEHNVSLSTYLVPSVAAYHRSSRWSWNHWSRATSACTHIVRVPPVQKSKAKHRNQQCIPTQHCRAIQTLTLALTSQCSRACRQQSSSPKLIDWHWNLPLVGVLGAKYDELEYACCWSGLATGLLLQLHARIASNWAKIDRENNGISVSET